MRRECRECFPWHRLQRKPLVNDPGMHHGTCVEHVPWCMSGWLTRGGGENEYPRRCGGFVRDVTHYNDVIMSAMASQITGVSIVCSSVGSGATQRKHLSSASLAFVWGIHRWPVNSPHKRPVTRNLDVSIWWRHHDITGSNYLAVIVGNTILVPCL